MNGSFESISPRSDDSKSTIIWSKFDSNFSVPSEKISMKNRDFEICRSNVASKILIWYIQICLKLCIMQLHSIFLIFVWIHL